MASNSSRYMTGNTTVLVKEGVGSLVGFVAGNCNEFATYTFYNNTTATGTVLLSYTTGSPSGGLLSTSGMNSGGFIGPLDIQFSIGLTVVSTGGSNTALTIVYC